jgi:pimeloyl-ACP methyl ester carboxylesterase
MNQSRTGRSVRTVTALGTGALLLLAAVGCGGSSASSEADAATTAPDVANGDFAGLVDIGDRSIYVQCTGEGTPTVVLISGNPIAADLWDSPLGEQPTVYQTASDDTRVCAYDRPGTARAIEGGGFSRSDEVDHPNTVSDSVEELHQLLGAMGETEPVVLAGHSYGGAVGRLYAHTHPDEVAGLVMVDSFTPELRDHFPADLWSLWKEQNATKAEVIADYPQVERFDFDETIDTLDAGGSIDPIPLVVLTADAPITDVPKEGLPDIAAATAAAHHAAQDQITQLAPGAVHVTETRSGHNIMLENPPVVTEAILLVVAAVRDGRTQP